MRKLFSSVAFAGVAAGLLFAAPAQAVISASDDPILFWNSVILGGITGGPPQQTREVAIANIAMYDALNAALGTQNNHYITGVAVSGGDSRAAVAQAAHDVLVALNPTRQAAYDLALQQSLAAVGNPGAAAAGQATGAAYAASILSMRSTDGAAGAGAVSYVPGTDPGEWRPTPPASLPAALPGWGDVTPFLLTSADQFRPGPPPAVGSAEYAAGYAQVMELGSATSATRTDPQTQSALFWNAANGLSWLQVGVDAASSMNRSTVANAQLFATLGAALADAFIAGFDTKYEYNEWRPITAIREGDNDGNPLTTGDANWMSLINAPNHPSYLSTHSIGSMTGATVLAAMLGDQAFCLTLSGTTQCFSSFTAGAQNAANSRLWGGIHFDWDNQAGVTAGRSIAGYELGLNVFQAVPEPSTWAMLLLGFGAVGIALRRKRRELLKQVA